jgi:hypothetical protein
MVLGGFPVAALALALSGALPGIGGTSHAAGSSPVGEPFVYTDNAVPAKEVTMIGSTTEEAGAGKYETWGIGRGASGTVVVRYAAQSEHVAESGWTLGPALQTQNGEPLSGFELDEPAAASSSSPAPSTLAGQMTAHGAGVLAGSVGSTQMLLVREPDNPANAFEETAPVPEAELESGDVLFGATRAPLIVPLDEEGGHAGALLVPVQEHAGSGLEESVLHWSGASKEWTKEKIELPSATSGSEFHVLAIGASSASNAWLLGELSSGDVALFHRVLEGGETGWKPVALKPAGEPGEPILLEGLEGTTPASEPLAIVGAEKEQVLTQVLTVTSQGVWIDGDATKAGSATIYFKPEGAGGSSLTDWCTQPGSFSCEHALPEALPTGPSRSIAWSNSGKFGERIIAGLAEGVTLRLEADGEFRRVLAAGGAGASTVGSAYGAAFSNPHEGWLGNGQLPVHVTMEHAESALAPWPTSFRHALVAVAPEPDVPVGALTSEALAVGDLGEVVRFKPNEGWVPETLLGPGGRRETPRLRAIAWPSLNRAYAVGDEGQMWLWRGETNLWEPDPAAPYNFRGNLLGIAFEPGNPARGYAVGEGGLLLGYGKTWTQEALPSEAPCAPLTAGNSEEIERCSSWADASFTSVAFAGSEALIAYRVLLARDRGQYSGGLIVNNGSGWHIDKGAAQVIGTNVPWAVAGLEDGGAAFGASGEVYEREGAGAPWQATPQPFPGGGEPGSLALFREGGALRVVAAGSVPGTFAVEAEPEAPIGSPPDLLQPYPLPSNPERGVLRQTASGWRDEEPELNNVKEPAGRWQKYDSVYEPDPVSAVLIDPTGSQGWAVGGFVEEHPKLDTGDIYRYPADGSKPLGSEEAESIAVSPPSGTTSSGSAGSGAASVSFAIGGNAQCAATCFDRANARIGPDVWLEHALQEARKTSARAFLYTGPRLVSPHAIDGPKESAETIDYQLELERYEALLSSSPIPAYAAATPTDRDEAGSEHEFREVFGGLPFAGNVAEPESAYYALPEPASGPPVRVLVLDDSLESGEVEQAQREWLAQQLGSAAGKEPAIVVGNADLGAQLAAGSHPGAEELVKVLVNGHASAYFFDSPEENVKETLRAPGDTLSVPAYGSGTLGYVDFAHENEEFLGDSGFLLAEVGTAPESDGSFPVHVHLIPNIGELALEAKQGTLLRRSHTALFEALARRVRAGNRSAEGAFEPETNPYIQIPYTCRGVACARGITPEAEGGGSSPEYRFSSSEPAVGGFVKQNLAAGSKEAVLLNAKEEPEREPSSGSKSGLFCAYNPGETTVSIEAGGLRASLKVTVEAGSAEQPCGTVPINKLNAQQQQVSPAPPPPAPAPAPVSPAAAPPVLLPVPPLPPAVVAPPARVTPPPATPLFFLPPILPSPLLALLPPPVPTPARPTPPSGTSAVSQPVEAAEKEEESEEATESVSNQAVAYHAPDHEPSPVFILGIVVLAAFAGASARRRPRRDRRNVRVAPATISTTRAQRRMSKADHPWR